MEYYGKSVARSVFGRLTSALRTDLSTNEWMNGFSYFWKEGLQLVNVIVGTKAKYIVWWNHFYNSGRNNNKQQFEYNFESGKVIEEEMLTFEHIKQRKRAIFY